MSSTLEPTAREDQGLLSDWLGDGIGLLTVAALGLLAAGLFAWFLAVTDQLLPHDLAWLSITEEELRSVADGRLVHFMAHDRAAFGGTLVAIAVLDLWLVRVPLAEGRAWAWWTLAVAGGIGFLSFLTYLGTGYLDTWHGLATLILLPLYAVGLARTRSSLDPPAGVGDTDVTHVGPAVLGAGLFALGLALTGRRPSSERDATAGDVTRRAS